MSDNLLANRSIKTVKYHLFLENQEEEFGSFFGLPLKIGMRLFFTGRFLNKGSGFVCEKAKNEGGTSTFPCNYCAIGAL
jgi:hypothetical protein